MEGGHRAKEETKPLPVMPQEAGRKVRHDRQSPFLPPPVFHPCLFRHKLPESWRPREPGKSGCRLESTLAAGQPI